MESALFEAELNLAKAVSSLRKVNFTIKAAASALGRTAQPLPELIALFDSAMSQRSDAESELSRARVRCLRALTLCLKKQAPAARKSLSGQSASPA